MITMQLSAIKHTWH